MTTTEVNKPPRRKAVRKPPAPGSKALNEIDSRLCAAIQDRQEAIRKMSHMVYWQDRFTRLSQEIEELISYQQRLMGNSVSSVSLHGVTADNRTVPLGPTHAFGADLPANIGSIPAKQPAVSGLNAADEVSGEDGFS